MRKIGITLLPLKFGPFEPKDCLTEVRFWRPLLPSTKGISHPALTRAPSAVVEAIKLKRTPVKPKSSQLKCELHTFTAPAEYQMLSPEDEQYTHHKWVEDLFGVVNSLNDSVKKGFQFNSIQWHSTVIFCYLGEDFWCYDRVWTEYSSPWVGLLNEYFSAFVNYFQLYDGLLFI